MTNTSLRERFGIKEENKAQASRFIKKALDAGKILPFDENAAPKLMKYIPHWARSPVVDKWHRFWLTEIMVAGFRVLKH